MNKCFNNNLFYALATILISSSLSDVSAQNATARQTTSNIVSLTSELKPFYNIADLPAYRDQTIISQISSYDTTGGNDDGFSGRYSYLRRRPDNSLVLFDVNGPELLIVYGHLLRRKTASIFI